MWDLQRRAYLWTRLHTAAICAVATTILGLSRTVYFAHSPDTVLITILPDDAFYYIQIALNRVTTGLWSFDGVAPTTGFHFLYAAALAAIQALRPGIDWRQLFLIIGLTATVFYGLSTYLVVRSADRLWGHSVAPLAALPFLTRISLSQVTTMMESWLVIFFAASTLYAVINNARLDRQRVLLLVLTGFLGSLSRTDYGLLPLSLFVCLSVLAKVQPGFHAYRTRSLLVILGMAAGILFSFARDYLSVGHVFQASAEVKHHWSSLAGHSALVPYRLIGSSGLPGLSWFGKWDGFCILTILLLGGTIWGMRLGWHKRRPLACTLHNACLLTLFGYVLFYRHNSQALQFWYVANFLAPMGIIWASLGTLVARRRRLVWGSGTLIAAVIVGASTLFRVHWPHQVGMMHAGHRLRNHGSGATYGAWNAGIIAFFSKAPVHNLDGLTNDRAVPFIKSNALFDFIKENHISYLVDYAVMLDSSSYRNRGGYADERATRCVVPQGTLDGDAPAFEGTHVVLYKVDANCL